VKNGLQQQRKFISETAFWPYKISFNFSIPVSSKPQSLVTCASWSGLHGSPQVLGMNSPVEKEKTKFREKPKKWPSRSGNEKLNFYFVAQYVQSRMVS